MASSRIARTFTVLALAACLFAMTAAVADTAHAAKRIVVLTFTGPKAAKFQADVEKALKKGNTMVPAARWKKTAAGLKATKVNAKNVKKVAKKLDVDAVVSGKVTKKGKRFKVEVTMRSGKTGAAVADVQVTAKGAKLSARETSDVKAQLLPALDELSSGGDDAVASRDDDTGGDEAGGGGSGGSGNGFGGDGDDMRGRDRTGGGDQPADDGTGENPLDQGTEAEDKRVATAESETGGGGGGEAAGTLASTAIGAEPALTVRNAAIDVHAGLTANVRSLTFVNAANLQNTPQTYSTNPVAGVFVGATVYPLGFDRASGSALGRIGVTGYFNRVIKLDSEVKYGQPPNQQTATLGTTHQAFGIGVQYRQPLGQKLWLAAGVRYNSMVFDIAREDAPAGVNVDVPDVSYAYVDPSIGAHYLISPKLSAGLEVRVPLALDAGEIQEADQYGQATITAIDLDAGIDYLITDALFARAGLRFMTFGYAFDGKGALSNNRDGNANTVDVSGARDTYYGGSLTAGYLF